MLLKITEAILLKGIELVVPIGEKRQKKLSKSLLMILKNLTPQPKKGKV